MTALYEVIPGRSLFVRLFGQCHELPWNEEVSCRESDIHCWTRDVTEDIRVEATLVGGIHEIVVSHTSTGTRYYGEGETYSLAAEAVEGSIRSHKAELDAAFGGIA